MLYFAPYSLYAIDFYLEQNIKTFKQLSEK